MFVGLLAHSFATIANFQWFSKLQSPLNGMVEGNHWDQWFSDGFQVRQPLVTMVFDGCAPSVRRWNGYVPSLKSILDFSLSRASLTFRPIRLQRWYITIPSLDRWCTTIENHRYQWLSYLKTIRKPLIPMVALNHSIQW